VKTSFLAGLRAGAGWTSSGIGACSSSLSSICSISSSSSVDISRRIFALRALSRAWRKVRLGRASPRSILARAKHSGDRHQAPMLLGFITPIIACAVPARPHPHPQKFMITEPLSSLRWWSRCDPSWTVSTKAVTRLRAVSTGSSRPSMWSLHSSAQVWQTGSP